MWFVDVNMKDRLPCDVRQLANIFALPLFADRRPVTATQCLSTQRCSLPDQQIS